jgi:hypothetical protein
MAGAITKTLLLVLPLVIATPAAAVLRKGNQYTSTICSHVNMPPLLLPIVRQVGYVI